jgi:hypothetical protein
MNFNFVRGAAARIQDTAAALAGIMDHLFTFLKDEKPF